MSLRVEMLQVARAAQRVLGESSEIIADFAAGQWNADGGTRDRAGASDLYYTVFGLEAALALGQPIPATVAGYLRGFGTGEDLSFVHRGCLARTWSVLGGIDPAVRAALVASISPHRAKDGGYALWPGENVGSAYGAYLAIAALQDLGEPLPDGNVIAASLATTRAADAGWANQAIGPVTLVPQGTTPATVAAVLALHACGMQADDACAQWLLARQHQSGGFLAHPSAPLPDLLSTATALHALACLEVVLPPERVELALDFVDTLWTNAGAFHGHWADEAIDIEYTYYGLLALGHLALMQPAEAVR